MNILYIDLLAYFTLDADPQCFKRILIATMPPPRLRPGKCILKNHQ